MSQEKENPFADKPVTVTRFQGLADQGYVVVITQAYGADGEDLMQYEDGPRFSGERGIRIRVRQGDLEEDIYLSPFFGDPSKVHSLPFKEGRQCELFCPVSGAPLDEIPGMRTDEGGIYYAVYLTPKLKYGELVAINDVWGNTESRMLSEDELLSRFADADE
ncbi:MAG: hypothetical protein ACNA8W_22290 [Bradymonadaceae bacterium]